MNTSKAFRTSINTTGFSLCQIWSILKPNTGEEWSYLYNGHWGNADAKKAQAEIDAMQNREVGKMGSFTEEEVKKFMNNMTINMGSMK